MCVYLGKDREVGWSQVDEKGQGLVSTFSRATRKLCDTGGPSRQAFAGSCHLQLHSREPCAEVAAEVPSPGRFST